MEEDRQSLPAPLGADGGHGWGTSASSISVLPPSEVRSPSATWS